jgi:hypothetical protein
LLDDPDVHALVLLESASGARKLLTVGPHLEHSSIEAVLALDLDGFVPAAYFDQSTLGDVSSRFLVTTASRHREMESAFSALQQRCQQLTQAHDMALQQLRKLREVAISQSEGFVLRDEELTRGEQFLAEREQSFTVMEESLVSRMDDHMQKAAELEQWEEDLFARERKLADVGDSLGRRKSEAVG